MSRRKRGRPVHGWLLVDKPNGLTSAAVVGRVKRAFSARKVGHAGTLDPAATGLLALAFGEATKTMPFVTAGEKTYRFTLRWGAATETDDAEGAVTAESPARPDESDILAVLPEFTGDIRQRPPSVSAVKVDGQRAYALARAGLAPDLAERDLNVARLELVETNDRDTASFEMVCGRGGYVRSIGRDIGERLGCLAHVVALRRLASGRMHVRDAVGLDVIEAAPSEAALDALLHPVDAGLAGLMAMDADADAARSLRNGNAALVTGAAPLHSDALVWARHDGTPVAIGRLKDGILHPERVFVLD